MQDTVSTRENFIMHNLNYEHWKSASKLLSSLIVFGYFNLNMAVAETRHWKIRLWRISQVTMFIIDRYLGFFRFRLAY